MGLGNSYEAKLMECFTSFEVKDILGFAKIVKVDPEIIKKAILNEDWEELIITTVEFYSALGRKERREILKLAKEIEKNNDEFNRVKEQNNSPQN